MKAAEILRKLADVIEQNSQGAEEPSTQVALEPVEVDNTDNTETTVVVPPLQAKLELLKKSMGMDNAYSSEEPCDSAEDAELALIKQRAGVPVVAVAEMTDDEPYEG